MSQPRRPQQIQSSFHAQGNAQTADVTRPTLRLIRNPHNDKDNGMYGWLTCTTNTDGILINAVFPNWDLLSLLANASKRPFARDRFANAYLLCHLDIGPAQFFEHPTAKAIYLLVEDDQLEYACSLFAAHYGLPEAHKSWRENLVAQVLREHLVANQGPLPSWAELMKGLALLLPDASLDSTLRAWLTQALTTTVTTPGSKIQLPANFTTLVSRLQQQAQWRNKPRIRNVLTMVLASRNHAQRDTWFDLLPCLGQASQSAMNGAIDSYCRRVANREVPVTHWHGINALAKVLESISPAAPDAEWADRLQLEMDLAEMVLSAENTQGCLASMMAIAAGRNIGPRTRESQLAMEKFNSYLQKQAALVDIRAHELMNRPAQPEQAPGLNPEGDQLDRQSLQAWSIDQLASWIEGPLPSQAGPVDRAQVIERARGKRNGKPANASPETPSPLSPPPVSTEEDMSPQAVNQLIREALGNTARYFKGELTDLRAMTQQMAVPGELKTLAIGLCDRLSPSLMAIENQESSIDEPAARELLHATEREIDQLRRGITQATQQAQLDSRFTTALNTALTSEKLVLGKRSGGTIACPVPFGHWKAICDGFHQRWLPTVRQVVVNGISLPLQPDQALALYVTGSSQSGFAFDVSVHLWRRRPKRNSMPSLGTGRFPPMNTEDWFDTYQTCCVLHVPHAR